MKTILCYGDSNTHGYNPSDEGRYPYNVRWTGVLQDMLGDEYRVIEEGCNGRTTIFHYRKEDWKNGYNYLKPCLNSHRPIDIVIMMLGTNDLKKQFHASAKEIAEGAGVLVDTIINFCKDKQGYSPEIILVSPPHIGKDISKLKYRESFNDSAISRSKELAPLYKELAEKKGCNFLDAARIVSPSELDSLHLSAESHHNLASALNEMIISSLR